MHLSQPFFSESVQHHKFFVNNPLDIKENDEHALISLTFFGLGEFGLCHWEGCCFVPMSPVITTDKKVASLTKLLADIDTLQLLVSCQKSPKARY
jgi:hypothetical protein